MLHAVVRCAMNIENATKCATACQQEGGQTRIGKSQVTCSGLLLGLPNPQLDPFG